MTDDQPTRCPGCQGRGYRLRMYWRPTRAINVRCWTCSGSGVTRMTPRSDNAWMEGEKI